MGNTFWKIGLCAVAMMALGAVQAAPARSVAGASTGGNSPYATDAYPGFDGLDDVKKPERREKSWWFGVKRDTPAEQFAFAQELETEGDSKGAAKAYDALVREWPVSKEAPQAQLRFVKLLAGPLEDYEEAFDCVSCEKWLIEVNDTSLPDVAITPLRDS